MRRSGSEPHFRWRYLNATVPANWLDDFVNLAAAGNILSFVRNFCKTVFSYHNQFGALEGNCMWNMLAGLQPAKVRDFGHLSFINIQHTSFKACSRAAGGLFACKIRTKVSAPVDCSSAMHKALTFQSLSSISFLKRQFGLHPKMPTEQGRAGSFTSIVHQNGQRSFQWKGHLEPNKNFDESIALGQRIRIECVKAEPLWNIERG